SDSLWGDYRAWEKNPILTQRTLPERKDGVYCAGHADLFQDIHGKWWSVFLASRRIDGKLENLGRETFLMPVRWTDDGWPVITDDDAQVPLIVTIPGTKRGTAPTFGNFIVKDNFDQLALP
ncbi:family 43 glycosylhydrolase, partial [Escherichia coli]|nr:family 43 glycosylhydrolase [Escherichia coli]